MRDLMKTIATCFEQVAFFFPSGDPKNQESFQRRANYLDLQEYSRAALADTLKSYHEALGANPETFRMIEELRHKETLVVITGQQAGFFTGPLYTLYKAITTIQLAKEQREKLGRPVVPVFWIAGEDHDWQEICKTYFLNSEGKPISCTIPGDGVGKSVGHQRVPAWETIEDQFKDIPESEFRSSVLKECRQITEKAENLSQWFALTLQYLINKWGLIFFDPMIEEFKLLAMPMYERIMKMHMGVRKALADRTEKWVKLGFTQQIHPTGGELNLFLAIPERRAILNEHDYFYLRGQKERWDLDTLNQMLHQSPEQFSPNVVTRPIIQEYLFPTLAYVPGPGELNYWAQLGEVFSTFNFVMPILYPRLSAVVLTPAWQKSLRKQGLTIEDVYKGLEKHKNQCVRERDSHDIDEHFEKLYQKIKEGYGELKPLEDIHVNVHDWLLKNESKVNFQLDYLKEKIWQAQRKRCSDELRHLHELEDGITPLHSRQERILNPLTFVCRYGRIFVDYIAELPIDKFQEHKIML